MKQIRLSIIMLLLCLFSSCQKDTKVETFKVGATASTIGILNNLKDDFKKVGLNVEIIEFSDYTSPDVSLMNKKIDANFYQHLPFLYFFKQEHHAKLTAVDNVIISPMAIYSKKLKNINEFKQNMTIGLPCDPPGLTRALLILEDTGVIRLANTHKIHLTIKDIVDNKLQLRFFLKDASKLPSLIDKVDATFISGSVAVDNGLNITNAMYVERVSSPYSTVVAVREGDEYSQEVKKFMKVLKSKKTKDYVRTNFNSVFTTY